MEFLCSRVAEASNEEMQSLEYIEALEQSCLHLERGLGLLDLGAVTHQGSARLAVLETSCVKVQEAMMRLQHPVDNLQSQLEAEQKKVEDQAQQVKKLKEKLVTFHRKKQSMAEEIQNLDGMRRAMETERRRLEVVKGRNKADYGDENSKIFGELDEVNKSMKEGLERSSQEITHLSNLLQERDLEIADLLTQLETQDAQRDFEKQTESVNRENDAVRAAQEESSSREQFLESSLNRSVQDAFVRSAQESSVREQFLEISLNRSMQDVYMVQGVQVSILCVSCT